MRAVMAAGVVTIVVGLALDLAEVDASPLVRILVLAAVFAATYFLTERVAPRRR